MKKKFEKLFGVFDYFKFNKRFEDYEPCNHPGCLNHFTHPCESCGRIGGKYLSKNNDECK